jgi:hypothetical protein
MFVKRYIEEVLPKLAEDQKLGKDGLARLYAAQDLLLYEKALESIKYIEDIFNNRICRTIDNCEELKKLLLQYNGYTQIGCIYKSRGQSHGMDDMNYIKLSP